MKVSTKEKKKNISSFIKYFFSERQQPVHAVPRGPVRRLPRRERDQAGDDNKRPSSLVSNDQRRRAIKAEDGGLRHHPRDHQDAEDSLPSVLPAPAAGLRAHGATGGTTASRTRGSVSVPGFLRSPSSS